MYPISAGVEDATNRINRLLKDGYHSEALVTSVFTVEKTMRRVLRQLVVSAGFNSNQANRYMKKLSGINSVKEHWEFFDPDHRKLPDIIGQDDWRKMASEKTGFSYMRNQLIHGIRTYNLSECEAGAKEVILVLQRLVVVFNQTYGYDGWSRATQRKFSRLHADPKVKTIKE
jgi:hypothetical protein